MRAGNANAACAHRKKLRLTGVLDYFDTLVTGDEVRRGKPDPEHYVVAAARLGVAPETCWALEDSENGVRSALSAGCRVYQIPDLVPVSASVSHLGQTVLSSLVDVVEILERAIKAATGSP